MATLPTSGPLLILPPARTNGTKGMRLRLKMVVCLGLRLSRICQFLWKRMVGQRYNWTFKICGLSPRGRHLMPTLAMCMGLGWRVRTKTVRTRIWSSQVKLLVAPLLTFVTPQQSPPPLLTVPRVWCLRMMWMPHDTHGDISSMLALRSHGPVRMPRVC